VVPPFPYRYKTHFLLALVSRSPLPPPLHSILPPSSLLDVLEDGVHSLHRDTEAHEAVAKLEAPLLPHLPTSSENQPQEGRKVLCLVHAQRMVRREDRKVNSDISLGTMRSEAEAGPGLCGSSFPMSSTRPLSPGEHLMLLCSPRFLYHHPLDECKHLPVVHRGWYPPCTYSLLPAERRHQAAF